MSSVDALFSASVGRVTFGREHGSLHGLHVDEVDGLSVGEVQEVGVAQYDGTGQHDIPNVMRDPRIITINGTVHARSMWELGHFEDLLRDCLIGKTETAPFVWREYGRTRWCQVRRYRGWAFTRIDGTGLATFTARFRAPSQLIFGDETTYGPATSVEVVNRGTFAAYPVIEVTGSMPSGYSITSNGRSYVVAQGLSAGQTHTVDMRNGVLLRNGVAQVGAVTAPRKLLSPTGRRTFTLDPVSGSGLMTLTHRDTYV